MDGTPVIEVRGLHTRLGGNVIHRDLQLDVLDGEVLAIIGGSGTGKTTLMRLMLGLERAQAGEVRVLGHPLGACAACDLERVQHRRGVLFQPGQLFTFGSRPTPHARIGYGCLDEGEMREAVGRLRKAALACRRRVA